MHQLKKIYYGVRRKLNKKIEWKYPQKVKVVIYEANNSDIILEYTGCKEAYVLSSSKINIFILLLCIAKRRFSFKEYYIEYIKATDAKVVITSIDNDFFFWSLKQYLPQIKTIMLQYGWHSELSDIFGDLKRNNPGLVYSVDYMMFFNENIKQKYLTYIKGNSFVGGSFKNNHLQFSEADEVKGTAVFVSQYRPEQLFHPVFFYEGGVPFYRDDFYVTEKKLLPFLYEYCKNKGLRLKISGHGTTDNESMFFEQLIGNTDWDFVPRTETHSSYKTIHNSQLVIGVDSTLAYEAFGRGKRTALFPGRFESLSDDSVFFGWPGTFPENGPFWASRITNQEVFRVLDNVFKSSEDEWKEIWQTYSDSIMQYDPLNSKLITVLKSEGIYKIK